MWRWITNHPWETTIAAAVTAVVVTLATLIVTGAARATFSAFAGIVTDQRPVSVAVTRSSVISHEHIASGPKGFVFSEPVEDIAPAPPEWEAERSEWAYSLGAIDASYTEVQIIIQGRDTSPVILQDLRVNVLERREPMVGNLVSGIGGDALDIRFATFNLDSSPPTRTLGSGFIEGEGDWAFPLRVSGTEAEVLHLFVDTTTCDCSWVAELRYVHDGEQRRLTIDDGGEPFRTTSTQNTTEEYVILPDGDIVPAREAFGSP